MKPNTVTIRHINILANAIKGDLEIDKMKTFDEAVSDAMEFIENNADCLEVSKIITVREEHAQVTTHRDSEDVYWNDGKGYEYSSSGQILGDGQRKEGNKQFYTTVFDTDGNLVHLYHINA